MFNEQQIKEFKEDGLTDEQIEKLQDAEALKDTVKLLPSDVEAFIREYEERVPADTVQGMKAIVEIAQKDPEFFQKIVALDVVLASTIDENADTPVEKTYVTELSDKDYNTASKNFFRTLANLSDEDRKEFLKLIANITPDQKADMISRLTRE